MMLRAALIVLGLAMLGLSAGSFTRSGVHWPQRARFTFTAGISVIAVMRAAELLGDDPLPIWVLTGLNVFFAIGVWGAAQFYCEFPASSPSRCRRQMSRSQMGG